MSRRATVTKERNTGKDSQFRDDLTGTEMSRAELVRKIEQGEYKNYHVREINGVKTPASNPKRSKNKNLSRRVFLSYNAAQQDMVVIWRLQTLAAASGLHLDVPNSIQREDWNAVARMIDNADSIIALIMKQTSPLSSQVEQELNYAFSLSKPIVAIVEKGVSIKSSQSFLQQLDSPVFQYDPHRPWQMEAELAEYLESEDANDETTRAILAIAGTLGGLVLLQSLTKD